MTDTIHVGDFVQAHDHRGEEVVGEVTARNDHEEELKIREYNKHGATPAIRTVEIDEASLHRVGRVGVMDELSSPQYDTTQEDY